MILDFTKMHGLGNDFVVIDAISQAVELTPEQIRFLADRHFGVGCDQVLVIERPTQTEVDFRYRIFNADGSEVGQCGNGARCFARYVRDRGLTRKNEIAVETSTGIIHPRIEPNGEVTVNMGKPQFEPASIPFKAEQRNLDYVLRVGEQTLNIGAVSMGNPHAVLLVDDTTTALVAELGTLIEHHERFPERVNVGFMRIINRRNVRLRVHERGVGETLACGTGACAAMVIGRQLGLLDDKVYVDLPGGRLFVQWSQVGDPVWMTGPAAYVFEGKIEL